MNIEKEKQKAIERHERHLEALDSIGELPFLDKVQFVADSWGDITVYMNHSTFDWAMDILTQARKLHEFNLGNYYVNGDALAIQYRSKAFLITFFCSDIEESLKRVSNGKCLIQEVTKTETSVVCNVGAQ